jgi:UDP-N-acetylglucosamine diphosphorylase/glucosamine-1-phosphate N-acetyltransferase
MMHSTNIVVYEDAGWQKFLPLVYMRATFQLRCGMFTLLDRVIRLSSGHSSSNALFESLGGNPVKTSEGGPCVGVWCRPLLRDVVALNTGLATNEILGENTSLLLNGRAIWKKIPKVESQEGSWIGVVGERERIVCIHATSDLAGKLTSEVMLDESRLRLLLHGIPRKDLSDDVTLATWPWDLVNANSEFLFEDGRNTDLGFGQNLGSVDQGSYLLNKESIHIGGGSRVRPCAVIDAESGPVWIGRNVSIFPHTYVQGPAFIGDGCVLQPGTVVRGGNTLGPVCKVGGEIEGSVVQGYSNKQHDGFLGHSYLGSWINIAADCVNSDLKNTYGTVRVEMNGNTVDTGETFVGMFVGDYSKAGINVSFPTGSVVGFCSNVFASISPKYVPSFAWINGDQTDRYDVEKGLDLARKVMARRNCFLSQAEEALFRQIRTQVLALEHQPQRQLEAQGGSQQRVLPTIGYGMPTTPII